MWRDLCAAAKSGSEVRDNHAREMARRRQRSFPGTLRRISYNASGGRSPGLEAARGSLEDAIAVVINAVRERGHQIDDEIVTIRRILTELQRRVARRQCDREIAVAERRGATAGQLSPGQGFGT